MNSLDYNAKIWHWRGYPISYQSCGNSGPAVVLIHGFGACWQHWRKNLPILGCFSRCYALDLIGFGASAKPNPSEGIDYTFPTWGQQVADFCREVVGTPVFLVGNSIGCIVAMQAVVDNPDIALKIALLNCSLRLLHERKQAQLPWYRRVGAKTMQNILSYPAIGNLFFQQIAKPKVVRKILSQAYKNTDAVSDELVEILLTPAKDLGAVDVFLAFTRYSTGPLPEDLLPILPCQCLLLWGTQDPWEPIELGRQLANYPTVDRFIPLEGLGHCPQDESPEVVNPILQEWILSSCLEATAKN